MFCQNCGTVLRADSKFCGECAKEVAKVTVEKPLSFEDFMASRTQGDRTLACAASSSGATNTEGTLCTLQTKRQKEGG